MARQLSVNLKLTGVGAHSEFQANHGYADIEKIPDSVGIDQLNKAISELKERNITEVMAQDLLMLALPLLQAEVKKGKAEESEEKSDEDMAFGWF
ncbi:large ribosomal subunit protein P2-like [Rattus norvegicus]|uniref:large ribosomal subunit protein P2-like n=1 Tax=Rattus norvegicus TaxID=10116 RepID=UPI001916E6AE|nr:60S acidic ribosomal protein P2-like [Rattus norvegicus]